MMIVVRHARPLTLNLDGTSSTHLTTALNVQDALEELKMNPNKLQLSTTRLRQIPVEGFKLNARSERKVTIVAGSMRIRTTTTGRTVKEVLEESNIELGESDRVLAGPVDVPAGGHGHPGQARPAAPHHPDLARRGGARTGPPWPSVSRAAP